MLRQVLGGHICVEAEPSISGGCVVGSVLLFTGQGLVLLEKLNPVWRKMPPDSSVEVEARVFNGSAVVPVTRFYYGGMKTVRKIVLDSGLTLTGTATQYVRVMGGEGLSWCTIGDLGLGRMLALPLGVNLWGSSLYEKQRAVLPSYSREAFLAYLRAKYVASLVRKPPELQLLADSVDQAQWLRLLLMNLGLMANFAYGRSECCQKIYVSVRHQYASALEAWISKGDRSAIESLRFKYASDPVKSIVDSKDYVFDLVVPDGHSFAAGGFMLRN